MCENMIQVKGRREGAPAVGATVLAWSDTEHHVSVCEHGRYGIYTSRESFAKKNHIWAYAFVFHAQHLASPTKALTNLEDLVLSFIS
jgi:hypothetical protein